MCSMNNDLTMQKLQNLALDWAAQFEKKPAFTVSFSSEDGQLTVNHIPTKCSLDTICADKATFDAEYFWIPTISGGELEIYLDLPFDAAGKIGHIKHIQTVYSADSQ